MTIPICLPAGDTMSRPACITAAPGTTRQKLGRFISADPIGYLGGLNLYAYVGNNPLNWIDPLGLCKELSRDEFYSRMSDMRDIAEERAWWERWRWKSYVLHDSYFFQGANNDRLFCFEGRKMLGSEINYYAIGMLYRRYWGFLGGFGKFEAKLDVYRWKIYNIPGSRLWYLFGWNDEDELYHLPTENELYMLKRGWEEYPKEDLFK